MKAFAVNTVIIKSRVSHVNRQELRQEFFEDELFKGFIRTKHPKNTDKSLYCIVCEKVVNVSHQGRTDLVRYSSSAQHKKSISSARSHRPINQVFMQNDDVCKRKVRSSEVKIAGFIAKHNLPITIADHIGPLLRDIVTDSDIVKNYSCARTKTTCILNRTIKPDLQKNLIDQRFML